jgi:DNA-binding response OmpR family regulator
MALRQIVLVGANLLVGSRVEAAARAAGTRYASARDTTELERRLSEAQADLVLIDLSAQSLDVAAVVAVARRLGVGRVIAFGPHKDVDSRAAALAAGCDRWLPNSRLAAELPGLLAGDDRLAAV